MIIAVNISNSVISVGFFEDDNCTLSASFELSCCIEKTSDEYLSTIKSIATDKGIVLHDINAAIISSVVPQVTSKISKAIQSLSKCVPILVGPGVKTGFMIKIDNPSELGGDMVANSSAALKMKDREKGAIIADIGSVCTISALNKNGEYIGCAIFPGVPLSLDALHMNASQLPNINLLSSSKAIGKNTQEAIRSGVVLGQAIVIDGFVEKITKEMKLSSSEVDLFATGEYAEAVLSESRHSFMVDSNLSLKGLLYIYKNTLKD